MEAGPHNAQKHERMQANTEADEAARDCCDNTCKTDQGLREAWKSSIGWSLIKRCHCRALGIGGARS